MASLVRLRAGLPPQGLGPATARVVDPLADAPVLEPEAGFVMASGIECSAPLNAAGVRMDELVKTGHVDRVEEDVRLVRETGIRYLRYGIPFHRVAPGEGVFEWAFVDRALEACRSQGVVPIADLLHFGVPDDLDGFQDPALADRFRAYAAAFAERYPWVRYYTPVNEPLITAEFSARLGYWNEALSDERAFVRALLNVARCVVLASAEIRARRSDAVLIQSDTCHYTHPLRPHDTARADLENELRFAGYELAYGRPLPGIVADHLVAHGATRADLAWFEQNGSDEGAIVGTDYYAGSEREVRPDGSLGPSGVRLGYYRLAREYQERLGRPFMHAETNAEGEGAVEWLLGQWAEVSRLRADGVPIRGFTWYGFIDHVDWDTALREDNGRQNRCGLVGLNRRPNPVHAVFRQLIAEASDDSPAHRGSKPSRR
jgi:beta-glucosidase/6-phospho-beta-glucosidase/beta-galactosidase